ncbi:ChaN family lipoprotein [Oligoflexus tunisiensis]|uniref:ChaN family lipoprotein n=1 Tax=Oligoflexus tunisiensis TaxID=708132 RepID=UPI001C406603|nr:ChaN family lipoprotein [Oligoflexus tunisiensis]
MNTAEIAAYSRNFQASLPSTYLASSIDQLATRMTAAQITLFGDFHTLRQSQRGFLRILRHIRNREPQRPLMVALEIFNAEDQPVIDEFLAGRLPEDKFLKCIDYHNKWGFPWENYQPIVAFCAEQRIRVCGINSQFDTPNRLTRRDAFAARILNEWAANNPQHLCLCLIGEYHLADQHLLAHLNPAIKSVRVVNNIDEYAFSSKELPLDSTDYLQLAQDFFCVLNTAPWIKWQSLAMWEEFHASWDGTHGDDFDLYTEHQYDFDYQLLHILKALNQFMGLNVNTTDLSHFDLYIKPDKATRSYIKAKLKLTRAELSAAERRCEMDGFAYFSPSGTVLLREPSINRFAEIAGFYLYDMLQSRRRDARLNFMGRIERQVCGTLAASIMNPRRPRVSAEGLDLLRQPERILEDLARYNEKDRQQDFGLSRHLGEYLGSEIFQRLALGEGHRFEENLRRVFKGNLLTMLELFPLDQRSQVA